MKAMKGSEERNSHLVYLLTTRSRFSRALCSNFFSIVRIVLYQSKSRHLSSQLTDTGVHSNIIMTHLTHLAVRPQPPPGPSGEIY